MRSVLFHVGLVLAVLALASLVAVAVADSGAPVSVPIDRIMQMAPWSEVPWLWRPVLSWGGAMHADSFYTNAFDGGGVWDLGLFTLLAPGLDKPHTFAATFGVATDASEDAKYEICIYGNPSCTGPTGNPLLAKFQVDQNNPCTIGLALDGLFRLEIQYKKLAGSGSAVMIDPKIAF